MAWIENINKPITEIKRLVEPYEIKSKTSKQASKKFYYKVEWLQGIYRTFRRFRENERDEMERFWQHLIKVSSQFNPKIEDLL